MSIAPHSPLSEALEVLVGDPPPDFLEGVFSCEDLSDDEILQISDWCSLWARPEWATGTGVLEAAELMVQDAVDNDNISRKRVIC